MNTDALTEIGRGLVPIVTKQIQEAVAPLVRRLEVLEARPVARSIQGAMKNEFGVLFLMLNDGSTIDTGIRDGATPSAQDVRGLVEAEVGRVIPPMPDVAALLKAAVAELPLAQDGQSPDSDELIQVALVAVDKVLASPEGQAILREAAQQASQPGPVGPRGPQGPPGLGADPELVERLVRDHEAAVTDAATLADRVEAAVTEGIAKAVAALPIPKDGAPGRDADPGEIAQLVKEAVEKHRIDIEGMVDEVIRQNLDQAMARLPAPRDGAPGKDADMDALLRRVSEEVAKAASAIPPGRDGVGIAGAIIDRKGHLVVTTTDGRVHDLGPVVGRDGTDGVDGKEGPPGRDGRDGFGFEDMTAELQDKALVITFKRGADSKVFEMAIPFLRYRGVWKQGESYEAGDVTTWGGSAFVALRDTVGKPEASDDWQLAVKRGRDGSNGKDGKQGETGPKGERGRDLTQLGTDGSKW